MFFPSSDWYMRLKAVADPYLQIIGARSSRPWDKGGGGGGLIWKKYFRPFGPQFRLKIRGGGEERTPSLYTPLPSSPEEKGPSDHACTLQGFVCLTSKKGQDWLPHFELFWTFSFHGKTFEVCFPYFNLMWLCSSCRMRSSLPRLECLPSHWGNSILCPMPPLIRSDGITQDIIA